MTDVNKIKASTRTGKGPPRPNDPPDSFTGGTDGEVFLFIGGREFRLNIHKLPGEPGTHNDHVAGQADVVILGEGSNVDDPQSHDPRTPYGTKSKPLVLEDLERYPMWLRFEPRGGDADNWLLEYASVEVFAKGDPDNKPRKKYEILLEKDKNLWLGKKFGLCVSMRPMLPPPTPPPPPPPPPPGSVVPE